MRLARRSELLAQGERLAEGNVDPTVAPLHLADHAEEPGEALRLLRAAALLRDVAAEVLDLVVGDRDRDEIEVVALAPAIGVDDVRQQPETRRQQLAGPRASAFDVPLES